jgi:hypothetical protein
VAEAKKQLAAKEKAGDGMQKKAFAGKDDWSEGW